VAAARPGCGVPCPPLDEEGKGRLGGGLLEAGKPPAKDLAASACARADVNRETQPTGNGLELVSSDGPPERLREGGLRFCDPAPERAPRGLRLVDDRNQLEISLTERHDPVGRAPVAVTAALDRRQAVPRFDLARGCGKVGHRNQYVVELQNDERSRP